MAVKNLILKLGLKGVGATQKGLSGVDSGVKNIGKSVLKAGAAFFAAQSIINGIKQTVAISSTLTQVRSGFDNLTAGIGGSTETLAKLQEATNGTVDSIELMTQANNAMLLGIFDNNDQMAEMFDVAQRLGAALGRDTTFGVESLVTGMGRQSKLMLDNLGIMVDIEEANKRYAKELGKSTNRLTDQEKKQAFNNETMRQAKMLVADLGEEQLTTADRINQLRSASIDMAGALGQALTPAFNTALDIAGDFASGISNTVRSLSNIDFTETSKNILGNISALLDAIKSMYAIVFDALPEAFSFAFGKIIPIMKGIFERALNIIKDVGSFLFQPVALGAEIIAIKVQNIFIGMFNFVKEQFNAFADTFIGEKLNIEKLTMTDFIDTEGIAEQLSETGLAQIFIGEDQVQNLSDFTEQTQLIWQNYFDSVKVLKDTAVEEDAKRTDNANKSALDSLKKTNKAKKKLSDEEREFVVKQTSDALGLAAEAASQNKDFAVVGQKLKFGQAVVNAYQSASETFAKFGGFPTGVAPAALAFSVGIGYAQNILRQKFADGGIVPGVNSGAGDTVPAMLTPGEVILNQAQQENLVGGMGGITINFNAPVTNEEFVKDFVIPEIEKTVSGSLA
jgi:hypothetical protein